MSRDTQVDAMTKGDVGFLTLTPNCYDDQEQGDGAPNLPDSYDTVPDSDDAGYSPSPMMGGMVR